jgi:hypothetical protein
MKRVITFVILGHWLLFFVLHALGALAGTLTFSTLSSLSSSFSAFEAHGPMRAMPLIAAGMGLASLLAATLFLWALLATIFNSTSDGIDGEIEKTAFGGAGLVFSMLSAIAVVQADPTMLLASTGYFAALILSWSATRLEWLEMVKPLIHHIDVDPSKTAAKTMASAAAHHNLLARIAGRERT